MCFPARLILIETVPVLDRIETARPRLITLDILMATLSAEGRSRSADARPAVDVVSQNETRVLLTLTLAPTYPCVIVAVLDGEACR